MVGEEEAECRDRTVSGVQPPANCFTSVFVTTSHGYPTAPMTHLTNPVPNINLNPQACVCILQNIANNVIPTTFVVSCKLNVS